MTRIGKYILFYYNTLEIKIIKLKFSLKTIDKNTITIDEIKFYYICKDSNPLNY